MGLHFSFSTLYGSKWVATSKQCYCFSLLQGFSTLYGSKWVATVSGVPYGMLPPTFQYPLRVEVGCNHCLTPHMIVAHRVSVPSTGRSGLQLGTFGYCLASDRVSVPSTGRSGLQLVRHSRVAGGGDGFQYPLRVEVGCNRLAATGA